MIALLFTALLFQVSPPLDGQATYMARGKLARAARTRGLELDGAAVFVALNDCRYLGRLVWLEHAGEVLSARVADCCQRRHLADRERRGYVAEVGKRQARRWSMRGPVPVRVHFSYPGGMPCEHSLSRYRCS